MKRLPIILLVLALIIVGISFILNTCDKSPSTSSAPSSQYQVVADNRVYYTDSYTQGTDKYGMYVILLNYWSLENNNWVQKTDLYLSKRAYKSVRGINRDNGSTVFVLN